MSRPKRTNNKPLITALAVCAGGLVTCDPAEAVLSYSLEGVAGWPNQAHYDAAVAAIQSTVDRYNAYSPTGFGNYNVYVYYDAGIPTAQASFAGSIGFGGTYPAERVMMHEMAHYLGLPSGNWNSLISGGWSGSQGAALVQQLEGDGAVINGDSAHFWPYGLNFDSEGSEINKQRQVAMVYAMRADLGIGPAAHPSAATTVTLTASDPLGTSGFNYKDQWSDGYFAHAGADYLTGDYHLRTPASGNSFTFAGDSLTVNNTNGTSGGLIYKGTGTSGVVTIGDLRLDGGMIQHLNGLNDLFQLNGNLNVVSDSVVRASQGDINILADISGSGGLTIEAVNAQERDDNRYVRFMSGNNTFTGDITNNSRFVLSEGANFTFQIGVNGVNNSIGGAGALKTAINGVFDVDLSGASSNQGDAWALVTAANTTYGANFGVNGFDGNVGNWSNGSYTFSQATGLLTLVTQWAIDGGGAWSNGASWTAGVPASGGDATLGSVLTPPGSPALINMDVPVTLNRLTIDNTNSYTLTGANMLTLTGSAQFSVKAGEHEVAVPVAGTSGLNKSGGGSLILSAANPYSGDTTISAGTLKLAGAGSISNSANIHVEPGATLDVSGLAGGFELAGSQTLNNNSNTTVVGGVTAGSGSTVTGIGTFADNLTMQSGSSLRIGDAGLPIDSSYLLIDHFDSYNNATNQNIGAHGNGDVTGGVWDGVFDGTNNGRIIDNTNPADNALMAVGVPGQGAGGWRGGVTDLADNFATDFSLAHGETATYFFQVMNDGNAYTDTMIGLVEDISVLDINNAWQDYAVRPIVVGSPGSAVLSAGGTPIVTLTDGQWQNVWVVVDNAGKTYDVYTSTGNNDGTLAVSNVSFGPYTGALNLEAFGITNREDGQVRIDNLYMTGGENTANPLGAGGGILYAPQVMTVLGDVTLESGSTVTFDIATSGVNDLLDITGHLSAGGQLEVVLDGLAPPLGLGDQFDLFDFSSASGAFNSFDLPALGAGLYWDTTALLTTGVLGVVDTLALPGDLSGDGFVGIADLNIVLGNWNQNVTPGDLLSGDPTADGFVGIADLNLVLGNWNAGTPPVGNANIPEPSCLLLMGGGTMAWVVRRRH